MTSEAYKECIKIKKEMAKLQDCLKALPQQKDKYTPIEYKVRKEYYEIGAENWKDEYDKQYEKLSLFEKMKLVFK